MKLLTHNMLASNVRNITNRFPLGLKGTQVEEEENEFNPEFTQKMLGRIVYPALRQAAMQVGFDRLPENPPDNAGENEEFLQLLYHALMNINVIEGELICPESGRVFPIKGGIPNMLLNEDEV
uniref:Multifunctional methyltransferase subunit TRM112-like protein n=1 Tax=Vannella robusta TaxID=1487602 RepID=A0A7S4MKV4_9EUKA|mmetsp:Transcript_25624/g.32652  ORF Transcript_25624/g.32652 Transcript_25624/m.32652 type:complete len:123 (+) Transcript_25624:40-408(+)